MVCGAADLAKPKPLAKIAAARSAGLAILSAEWAVRLCARTHEGLALRTLAGAAAHVLEQPAHADKYRLAQRWRGMTELEGPVNKYRCVVRLGAVCVFFFVSHCALQRAARGRVRLAEAARGLQRQRHRDSCGARCRVWLHCVQRHAEPSGRGHGREQVLQRGRHQEGGVVCVFATFF